MSLDWSPEDDATLCRHVSKNTNFANTREEWEFIKESLLASGRSPLIGGSLVTASYIKRRYHDYINWTNGSLTNDWDLYRDGWPNCTSFPEQSIVTCLHDNRECTAYSILGTRTTPTPTTVTNNSTLYLNSFIKEEMDIKVCFKDEPTLEYIVSCNDLSFYLDYDNNGGSFVSFLDMTNDEIRHLSFFNRKRWIDDANNHLVTQVNKWLQHVKKETKKNWAQVHDIRSGKHSN